RNTVARMLSGGMKRKLMIVRALMHEPRVLILDEPTAGVDVETRREMWTYFQELNKQGTSIILTTHYLEEAEQMCDRIVIINHGIIAENTNMKQLLSKLNEETFVLDLAKPIKKCPKLVGYTFTLPEPNTLEVTAKKKQDLNTVFAMLKKQGITVLSMRNKTNRLEELFVKMTGNGGTKK
ncbi:ABC transporter ATP-binding protein, partial [Candidatus Woesearchaeota archaeon]|nr:ABC transporter ATP-binding protein [Candidatus Woesearchaeota archaeon]